MLTGTDLRDLRVAVTGGTSGLGLALVRMLTAQGAQVAFVARNPAAVERIANKTGAFGIVGDVARKDDIYQIALQITGNLGGLDVLINNAGIAIYDDLTNFEVIEKHLAVNFLGLLRVTHAFLPALRRSHGAIVNNLSMVGLAALPIIPAYSLSKAAAFNMTQSLRALLAGQGVTVHAVVLGPVDTDMNRGFNIPKASPESGARGIFDGLEKGEEDIFPDPDPASQSVAEGWRTGVAKALEHQFAAFVPASAAQLG